MAIQSTYDKQMAKDADTIVKGCRRKDFTVMKEIKTKRLPIDDKREQMRINLYTRTGTGSMEF